MSVFETLRVGGWRSGAGDPPVGHVGWPALLARPVLGALVAVSATCALLLPAEMVVGDAVRDLDRDLAIDAHRFTASERVVHLAFEIVTFFGSTVWLTLMVGLTAISWVRKRRTPAAALLVVTAIGSAVVCRTIKLVISRDRPSFVPALADPYGSSFPSGHAMQSVAIYGVLLLIVAPRWAPRARWAVLASVAGFVAAIAISRVMLGVHYVSDITVGLVLGLVWLAAVALLDPLLLEGIRGDAPREGRPREGVLRSFPRHVRTNSLGGAAAPLDSHPRPRRTRHADTRRAERVHRSGVGAVDDRHGRPRPHP